MMNSDKSLCLIYIAVARIGMPNSPEFTAHRSDIVYSQSNPCEISLPSAKHKREIIYFAQSSLWGA